MTPPPAVARAALRATFAGLLVLAFARMAPGATVHVDRGTKHQTIEGFGFFGARDAWWNDAEKLVDPAWAHQVIDDLGITMWRNEYFPAGAEQDADFAKQRGVALALRDQAAASGVPLKTILTVWSPPASMKCASDRDNVHEGKLHPGGTKGGGAVCPSRRGAFAQWLIDGLKLYAGIGVDVYALSIQNEPMFRQGFNSAQYPQAAYADLLEAVGPRQHAVFPKLLLFWAENKLEDECGREGSEFEPGGYTGKQRERPKALEQLGAFAVHGYSDGVDTTQSSKMARH